MHFLLAKANLIKKKMTGHKTQTIACENLKGLRSNNIFHDKQWLVSTGKF
jgi:hypothetical protein